MSIAHSTLTAPVAERIRTLHASGASLPEIAEATGIRVRAVNEVVRGRRDGRPLTAREQADEDERTGWAPLCLDAAEWADWRLANPLTIAGAVARPCDDCPLGFAADMRAAGRCNGTPRWTAPDEEPAHAPAKETPMPASLEGLTGLPRALAISACVDRHSGDRRAAAAELGIRSQEVGMSLARYGLAPGATPRAPKNRPAAKADPEPAATVPVPPEVMHTVVHFADPATSGPATRVEWYSDGGSLSVPDPTVHETWAQSVDDELVSAATSLRHAWTSLAVVAGDDRRARHLVRRVRRLRRDVAELWMDRQP